MRLVLTDLRPLLTLLPFALALLAALGWLQFRSRWRVTLSPEEWQVLLRLLAIPVLILVLVTARVVLQVPATQFLYGRF